MHTSPKSGSATLPAPGRYEPPEQNSNRTSDCLYQCVTLAAMVLVLASLWVF
ncbi:MAG TPA: hypothetical protein VME23_15435 [Terracidiphilus sp.]|nr:hypothetical protein [Terracidiphilus sp.]